MEMFDLQYSAKNIPTPSEKDYLKMLTVKAENVVRNMRWKAHFFDSETDAGSTYRYEIKTRAFPPRVVDLEPFESGLMKLISNVKFHRNTNPFQQRLQKDIKKIKTSDKVFIPSDKTKKYYEVDRASHVALLTNSITQNYQVADAELYNSINNEAKCIAKALKLDNRLEALASKKAFISLKDHKEHFATNPKCRLLNPAKSELGLVSKNILRNIINAILRSTRLKQWKNSFSVIEWFGNIDNKDRYSFTQFDIVDFYPTISEDLLAKALDFGRGFTQVSDLEIDTIWHARRTLLFALGKTWVKKSDPDGAFDVAMGAFDSADVCDLTGLYILDRLSNRLPQFDFGLYRDDGLAISSHMNGQELDRARKIIISTFNELGLRITIDTNLKIVDFLDVTLNLSTGLHKPFSKPTEKLAYIHKQSCHPPTIFKNLVKNISKRISCLSSNSDIFDKAAPYFNKALADGGHRDKIEYLDNTVNRGRRTNRKRKIIWFAPPFSLNVHTNIGKKFLDLIDRHFPVGHRYRKIFNRSTLKTSYSAAPNMRAKLNGNMNIDTNIEAPCNCRTTVNCPLEGRCNVAAVIYEARVVSSGDLPTTRRYIGMTEGKFKARYTNHLATFRHPDKKCATKLSGYVWSLKERDVEFKVLWGILQKTRPYSKGDRFCRVCVGEKVLILRQIHSSDDILNARSEIFKGCIHMAKHLLAAWEPG